ncbi:hypothetical protein SBBP2_2980004 [Burkholderiales bacterium]|nr:hypothetical protein SBBP2_2980004 [Burkholderiales bacterium]
MVWKARRGKDLRHLASKGCRPKALNITENHPPKSPKDLLFTVVPYHAHFCALTYSARRC